MVFTKAHLYNRTRTFTEEPEHWLCFEDEIPDCLYYEIGVGIQLERRPFIIIITQESKNESNSIPKFGICS